MFSSIFCLKWLMVALFLKLENHSMAPSVAGGGRFGSEFIEFLDVFGE